MKTQAQVTIEAPVERVWALFTDAQNWPSWTASVTSLEPLDGAAIAVGHRFRIKQPRLPVLDWEVTEVDAPHSWTWVVRSAGATTSATHELSPRARRPALSRRSSTSAGPLGVVVGRPDAAPDPPLPQSSRATG